MSKIRKINTNKDHIKLNVNPEVFKEYVKVLRENSEEFKIIKTENRHGKDTLPYIVIEIKKEFTEPKKILKLGAKLEGWKYKSAAQMHENEYKKKDSEKNLLKLIFPQTITREFKETYGDSLGLDKVIVGNKGKSSFLFDV